MFLDRNLPQRGCFVGLVQRFVVFDPINLGFTLCFAKLAAECEIALKPPPARLSQAKVLPEPQSIYGQSGYPHDTETIVMTAITPITPRIRLDEFLLLLDTHHPFAKVLGIKILEVGYGTATLALPPNPSFQRLGGIVAGPMLMGLADLAMYAAVVGATGNAEAVTASLTINFMRKSPPGTIYAHARVLKTGRLCAGDVTLTGEGSAEPLAHSVSTWSLPKA